MNRRRLARILTAVAMAVVVLSTAVLVTPTGLDTITTRTDSGHLIPAADRAAATDVLTVQLLLGLPLIYPLTSLAFRPAYKRRRR